MVKSSTGTEWWNGIVKRPLSTLIGVRSGEGWEEGGHTQFHTEKKGQPIENVCGTLGVLEPSNLLILYPSDQTEIGGFRCEKPKLEDSGVKNRNWRIQVVY